MILGVMKSVVFKKKDKLDKKVCLLSELIKFFLSITFQFFSYHDNKHGLCNYYYQKEDLMLSPDGHG